MEQIILVIDAQGNIYQLEGRNFPIIKNDFKLKV